MLVKILHSAVNDFNPVWVWTNQELRDTLGYIPDFMDKDKFLKYYIDCVLFGDSFKDEVISPLEDLKEVARIPHDVYKHVESEILKKTKKIVFNRMAPEHMEGVLNRKLGYEASASLRGSGSFVIDVVLNYNEIDEQYE